MESKNWPDFGIDIGTGADVRSHAKVKRLMLVCATVSCLIGTVSCSNHRTEKAERQPESLGESSNSNRPDSVRIIITEKYVGVVPVGVDLQWTRQPDITSFTPTDQQIQNAEEHIWNQMSENKKLENAYLTRVRQYLGLNTKQGKEIVCNFIDDGHIEAQSPEGYAEALQELGQKFQIPWVDLENEVFYYSYFIDSKKVQGPRWFYEPRE